MQVPASVLEQYNSVNARAQNTAETPFQTYNGEFVAPVNGQQGLGIANTNVAAGAAQPYYAQASENLYDAQSGVQPVNAAAQKTLGITQQEMAPINASAQAQTVASSAPLSANQIQSYLSPYLQTVLGSTANVLNQNNQQQQAGQLGNAISSGAFGGDRTGIAAANLEEQQNLANAQIYSGIANQGYQSALSTAEGQQQVGLQGAQQEANIGQIAYGEGANTASELASLGQTAYGESANTAAMQEGLGTAAQTAGLQGAAAEIGAGTLEQQTQQAQDTALYNQFLQQQSYPFQVDQFLANIAEGTGSLSGSTTTTQQPGGFFSDERLKEDKHPIGKTFDGQTIYAYKMKGDPRTRIGLMAQDVEEKHPEAVGVAAGYKTVDYGKATREAANEGHFNRGGVVPIRPRMAVGGDPYDINSILAVQQQMYQPHMNQRDIPNQPSGAHQLAVASGSPAPPPSGASNVQQSIGLGKDAYQAYKYFNKPSPTPQTPTPTPGASSAPPGTGVYPAADAPATESMAPAAADSASGVAPAADSAATVAAPAAETAAPAAAEGAASAAAPAAAEAAGTAAAGAGADAAATAGVDAAAALAAEYAVADAAVAVAAAKRGGRIGLAAGGIPYEGDGAGTPYAQTDGVMAIPDTENSNKLQTAGPLKKQPTGLQTLITMANPNDWGSIAGSTLSNQALMRGGRTHKDDGGMLTDDSGNPVELQADPPTKTFEGVAPDPITFANGTGTPAMGVDPGPTPTANIPNPDSPAEAAKQPDPDVDHWWKHAENVVPLLSGIAAMGTAPTRSWGRALASGLGAGAESWIPAHQQEANVAQTQAQTTGLGIQNQSNQLTLDAYRAAMKGTPATSQATHPPGSVSSDSDDPQEVAYQRFAPIPTALPDSVTQRMVALNYAKMPQAAKAIGDQYTQRINNELQNRVIGANADYQGAMQVANAPPGQALDRLAKTDPARAAKIQSQTQDPAAQDAQARDWAQRYGFAVHQYSGRESVMQNGMLIDKASTAPVLGSSQVMTGLSAEGKQAAYNEGLQPVTLGNGLPGFRYQQAGFKTPEAYVIAQDAAARTRAGIQPAASAATSPAGTPNGVAPASRAPAATPSSAPVPVAAPGSPRAASPGIAPKASDSAAIPIPGARTVTGTQAIIPKNAPPELQKALADPTFKLPPLPKVVDQTSQHAVFDQQQKNIKNADELKTSADQVTAASQRAMQNFKAAKIILDYKGDGPVAGVPGAIAAELARVGIDTNTADHRVEAVKYLTNGALGGLKTTYGERPGVFDVKVNLEQAFPDVKSAGIGAVKNLIDSNIRALDYDMAASSRVPAYLKAGNDPADFNKWNGKYFDRATEVNAPLLRPGQDSSGPKSVVETRSYGGHTYTYDPASGPRTDPKNWKLVK